MKNIQYLLLSLLLSINVNSQEKNLSEGPFNQLIIRGATLVNGNGSPPVGPVDIVIEKNIIKSIRNVGYPGVEIMSSRRPKLKKDGREINASGMYVLPGFIDMHGHIGGELSRCRTRLCI
jgi:imidazolonepropionase-like amidohydrolase